MAGVRTSLNAIAGIATATLLVAGLLGPSPASATSTMIRASVPAAVTTVRAGAALAGANRVTAFGSASLVPGTSGSVGTGPVVAIASTPTRRGYWLVNSSGAVSPFGDAGSYGSTIGVRLVAPVVGMAATPSGHGYWLVAADGGVFAFGDAGFYGSMGGVRLVAPVVGMAATPSGHGYWLVAADGGVFAFGDAGFYGSMGGVRLVAPVVGMAATPSGHGYWLVAADGGLFTFGDAPFVGSGAATQGAAPAVGIAGTEGGYWIAYGDRVSPVPAIANYVAGRVDNVTVAVDDLTTGQTYSFRPGVVEHTASTLKVDILATLLREAQAAGRPLTAEEQSLAVPMIEDSLDSAADTLWGRLGPAAVQQTELELGMANTVPATDGIWGTTTTTAADRLDMVRGVVFANPVLTNASRAYILHLMENITPTQDWGATGGVPPGVTVALKNGFAIINGWQINTTGWVDGQGRDYLIAVLTDENPTEAYGIATVNAISDIVWNDLG